MASAPDATWAPSTAARSPRRSDVSELVTYVLPIKCSRATSADPELADYLTWLSERATVVVADGSDQDTYRRNGELWSPQVRHVPVRSVTLNGKVAGVCDGVAAATTPYVVVADDDVRYDGDSLTRLLGLLATYDAVIPQNYFDPAPWHARWDAGRTLLNRALGADYAGTIAFRRSTFLATGGCCGAVLFENLELMRTFCAKGFVVEHATDVFVRRRPPTARHFLQQRLRQAYDSRAQPLRWLAELMVLPTLVLAGRRRARVAVTALLASVGAAEIGRRKRAGSSVWSWTAALWSPLWTAERAVFSWAALMAAVRGGVRYSGSRLARAAHRHAALAGSPRCPEGRCQCQLVLRGAAGANE